MGYMKDLLITVYGGGDDAVEAAKKIFTLGEWISVSERLPEKDKYVIVFTEEHGESGIHCAAADEDGVWYPAHGDGWMFPTVTHWMPLPEPPEVK
jgi:hypothetical protein